MKTGIVGALSGSVLAFGLGLGVGFAAEQDSAAAAQRLAEAVRAHAADGVKTEKAAYLGVSTEPASGALATQLGLPAGTGLVVTFLDPASSAVGGLRLHDVLTKLGDQILVNHAQLAVLIRMRKPGEEIKLTVLRGGKEVQVSATLAEKDLPPLSQAADPWGALRTMPHFIGLPRSAIAGAGVTNHAEILRKFYFGDGTGKGTSAFSFPQGGGQVRSSVSTRHSSGPGARSTTASVVGNASTFTLSDGNRTVTLTESPSGQRRLKVEDPDGKTLFDDNVTTKEDKARVPAEYAASLDELESMRGDLGVTIRESAGPESGGVN